MIGVLLDYCHRVTRVSHFRKKEQFGARLFGSSRKVAGFGKIRFWIAKRAGNLSDCDFHYGLPITFCRFVMSREVETSPEFSDALKEILRSAQNDRNRQTTPQS